MMTTPMMRIFLNFDIYPLFPTALFLKFRFFSFSSIKKYTLTMEKSSPFIFHKHCLVIIVISSMSHTKSLGTGSQLLKNNEILIRALN